jgi:hypothetical protein
VSAIELRLHQPRWSAKVFANAVHSTNRRFVSMYDSSQQSFQPEWWKHPLVWIGAGLALALVFDTDTATEQTCSVCGRSGHNRLTCAHAGKRINFSNSIPKSRHCECCGRRRNTRRHHTRGRADDSDFLDVCGDCHLKCCHDGDFYTVGIKPRVCRLINGRSFWAR